MLPMIAFLSACVSFGGDGLTPGIAHGGPILREHSNGDLDCVSDAERDLGFAAIRAYELARGGSSLASQPLIPFIPIGSTLYGDLLPPGYVDHDPTAGFQDYSCHAFTYDGHAGTDLGLHSFSEQLIGVPVFAALDGTVVYYHDGEPDMSTCLCGQLANALIIDHGGGRYGWYWHFRTNTVGPHLGDVVHAGQQLGLAGSSGNSGGPHLHFGVTDNGNTETTTDPFAGACGAAQSQWVAQPALDLHTYIADFGYSTQNLSGFSYYPYRFPNTGQMGFNEFLWFWAQVVNLPPHSAWRQLYIRPDGSTAFDSGDVLFESNQQDFYRVSNWWWYTYYVFDMRTIPGTWKVRLLINGQSVIEAPVEVRPTADPSFNRPPAPIAVAFDPPAPRLGDVLFARVTTASLALDDPDYDLVRFQYTWFRNGVQFRQNTFAGRADAIRADAISSGDVITCTVTPNDGHVSGSPVTVTISFCAADFNSDGTVDFFDYLDFVDAFSSNLPAADFNHDSVIDFFDYLDFVDSFSAGC